MRKKSIIWLLAILGIMVTTMAWCHVNYPAGAWRYKMTVTVNTPEGEKSGYAVRELYNAAGPFSLPDAGNAAKESGEAVVVDLGQRGLLFVLLSDQSGSEFYQAIPTRDGVPPAAKRGIQYYLGLKPGVTGRLDPAKYPGYPRMVAFKDINDPRSITLVYETRIEDVRGPQNEYYGQVYNATNNFGQVYGADVSIKEIIIETTNEPVSSMVGNALPWLLSLNGGNLEGQGSSSSTRLSDIIHTGNFKKDLRE